MSIISFIGLVTAWQPKPRHAYQLIICCMARTGPKMYHPVSLEGDFTTGLPDFTPEIGSYVYGKAQILQVWDGSILVEYRRETLRFNCVERCLDFGNNLLKFVYAPRVDRKLRLLAKEFYRQRLFPEYYPNQLNWNAGKRPFGYIASGILAQPGYSMAKIAGNALFIKKIKNNGEIQSLQKCSFETGENDTAKKSYGHNQGKRPQEKFALFLLAGMTSKIHNATFMIARIEKDLPLHRGSIYQFSELPILAVEDDRREEESTIFCGKGTFQAVENPKTDLLLQFYDELGNCEMMPASLWKKYFSGKLERTAIQKFKKVVAERLNARGVDIPPNVHGWWYYWGPVYRVKAQGEDEVAILAPDFRDAGATRVIIAPMTVYKSNRRQFPAYSSAVSVGEKPQIIEGAYRPEPGNWKLIKRWIIDNHHALEKDWLDIKEVDIF